MYPICYQQVSGGYLQPEPTMYSRCFHWFPGPLAPSAWKVSWVICKTPLSITYNQEWRGRLPRKLKGSVHNPMMGYAPCCPNTECHQEANPWLAGWWDNGCVLQRPEVWWLGVACWPLEYSVSSEERLRQVDGIYLLYSDSLYPHHNQPITSLATIAPLLSWPTGRSEEPHRYRYCWIVLCHDSHDPLMLTNLCSMFSSFICHDHILSHLPFAIKMILPTVSPNLVPLLTHSLLLSIFS